MVGVDALIDERTSPCHHDPTPPWQQPDGWRGCLQQMTSAEAFCPHMLDVVSLPKAKVLEERSEHSTAYRTSIG